MGSHLDRSREVEELYGIECLRAHIHCHHLSGNRNIPVLGGGVGLGCGGGSGVVGFFSTVAMMVLGCGGGGSGVEGFFSTVGAMGLGWPKDRKSKKSSE